MSLNRMIDILFSDLTDVADGCGLELLDDGGRGDGCLLNTGLHGGRLFQPVYYRASKKLQVKHFFFKSRAVTG